MTATSHTTNADTRTHRPVQTVARLVGIVFLIVGIAGFIPGLTSNYGQLGAAGMSSMAMLLGIFQVSVLHNVVHLLFGIVGIAASRGASASKRFLIVGGIVYAVLWLYGLVIDQSSSANFVPLNSADNWLHFVLAAGMILLGILVPRRDHSSARA
jgi:arginine exporter protein ArgO